MAIDRKYIRVEGLISKTEILDFPNYFFDVLLGDTKIARLVTTIKLTEGRVYKSDNKTSFQTSGKEFWKNTPLSPSHGYRGLILFNDCPFATAVIKVGRSDWGSYAYVMYCTDELKKGSFGDVIFKAKYGGLLGLGNPVDIEIKGDERKVPGMSTLRKDQDLISKIRLLLLSRIVAYKDIKGDQQVSQIGFSVVSNPFGWITGEDEKYGVIETGFSTNLKKIARAQTDYASLCKVSFEVAYRIAEHLKCMWTD